MSTVGASAATTVGASAATTTAMEAAAVAATHVAAVGAAAIVAAAETLVGLGVRRVATALSNLSRCAAVVSVAVVACSVVGRTPGIIAESAVVGAGYSGLASCEVGATIVAGKVGSNVIACKVRGAMVAAGERSAVAVIEGSTGEAGATGTAVEAVVRTVVDVAAVPSNVVVSTVVPEVAAAPVSAEEAGAEVAEAVVNATVVTDGRAPVACVPKVAASAVTPVARGPESANVGRGDPGAVDPFIAVAGPGPVAGSPFIAVAGGDGLSVDGDDGRRYGNKDACVSGCGSYEEDASESRGDDRIFEQPGELHQSTFLPVLRLPWFSRTSRSGED
jgi:hypothetical protein